MLKSSQSRVAKMENGDLRVSLDLLVKSLLAMGVKFVIVPCAGIWAVSAG